MIAARKMKPASLAAIVAVAAFICGSMTGAGMAWAKLEKAVIINSGKDSPATPSLPPVKYFSKEQVEKQFNEQKDFGTLYDSDYGDENFKVKVTSRTKVPAAEVHKDFTDVLYIVKGSATLVTGGKLVDDMTPRTWPDGRPFTETKLARTMEGGESRQVSAGDVIVIPNGVTHWFKQVNGIFWFFNVKCR
jgi:mannose-6-phosphate isomerase-like protein (cupin superfamily)